MSIEYYSKRLKQSLAAAKAASEPTSRIAHEGLARGYRGLLDALITPLERARQLIWQDTRDEQLRQALDEWENEGGGNRE